MLLENYNELKIPFEGSYLDKKNAEYGKYTYLLTNDSNKAVGYVLNVTELQKMYNVYTLDFDIDGVIDRNDKLGYAIRKLMNTNEYFYTVSAKGRCKFYIKNLDHLIADIQFIKDYKLKDGSNGNIEVLSNKASQKADFSVIINKNVNDNYYTLYNEEALIEQIEDDEYTPLTDELDDLLCVFNDSSYIEVKKDVLVNAYEVKTYRKNSGADYGEEECIAIKFKNADKVNEWANGFGPGNRNDNLNKLAYIFLNNKYLDFNDFEEVISEIEDKYDNDIRNNEFFNSNNNYKCLIDKEKEELPEKKVVSSNNTNNSDDKVYISPYINPNFITYGINIGKKEEEGYVVLEHNGYKHKATKASSVKHELGSFGIKWNILNSRRRYLITNIDTTTRLISLDKPTMFIDIVKQDELLANFIKSIYSEVSDDTLIINNYKYVNFYNRLRRMAYADGSYRRLTYNDLNGKLKFLLENVFMNDIYSDSLNKNLFLLASHFVFNRKSRMTMTFIDNGGTGKDTFMDLLRIIYSNGFQNNSSDNYTSRDIAQAQVLYYPELKIEQKDWNILKQELEQNTKSVKIKYENPGMVDTSKQMIVATAQTFRNIGWVADQESELKPFSRRFNVIMSTDRKVISSGEYNTINKNRPKEMNEAAYELSEFLYTLVEGMDYEDILDKCESIEKDIEFNMTEYCKQNRQLSVSEQIDIIIEDNNKNNGDLLNEILSDTIYGYMPGNTVNYNQIKDALSKYFDKKLTNEVCSKLQCGLWDKFDKKNPNRSKWSYKGNKSDFSF